MTIPFSNLLIQRCTSGKWRFTHKPTNGGKKPGGRGFHDHFPRYAGGGRVHLVDHKGDELAAAIPLTTALPGWDRYASHTTAGMCWEAVAFKFFHKGKYAVIYPWWGGLPPLIVDLVRFVVIPSGGYNAGEIEEAFKTRVRKGVHQILADMERGENLRQKTDPVTEVGPATFLHHAGKLQLMDLENSLRKIKTMQRKEQSYGDIKIAAAAALEQMGFPEEQQWLEAAASGDIGRIRSLLSKVDVNWSARRSCIDMVNYCDLNRDTTALHLAASNGHAEVVRLLLQVRGIDANIRDQNGQTPLFLSANKEILVLLLDCAQVDGALNETMNYKRHTMLHYSCVANNTEVVEELLRRGAKPNKSGFSNETCLHVVCEAGNLGLVGILIRAGAEVDAAARTGKTPLYVAVAGGHTEIVRILLKHSGLNVNVTPKASGAFNAQTLEPALCVVSKRGDLDLVKLLLEYPGVNAASVEAALVGAVQCNHPDVIELFLTSHAITVAALKSALVEAAKKTNFQVASLLLAHPLADSQCVGSALVVASEIGSSEMVTFLLQRDQMDPHTCCVPALNVACSNNHPGVAKLLLAVIDISSWERSGMALFHALKREHQELFELLLKAGASPRYKDKNGWTVLNTAVDRGCMDKVCLLLDCGADPNETDKVGWSALHWACCEGGDTGIVTLLLERGADGDLKSKKGDTPLDVARSRKHLDVVRLLVLRLSRELGHS